MATVLAATAPAANAVAEEPRPLGTWANGMHMTPEEFDAATDWDEGYRYELVNGVLIVSPPAGIGERIPNNFLSNLLWDFQNRHPNGRLVDGTVSEETVAEETVATSAGRRRMDRAIWIGLGRTPRTMQDVLTIGVEFVGESSRDRRRDLITKCAEYLAVGVRKYWVIDRYRRQMTVFRPTETLTIAEAEIYATDLLPGFELPLARLLKVADDWTSSSPQDATSWNFDLTAVTSA